MILLTSGDCSPLINNTTTQHTHTSPSQYKPSYSLQFQQNMDMQVVETLYGMSILSMYVLLLLSSLQSLGAKTVRVDKSMTGAAQSTYSVHTAQLIDFLPPLSLLAGPGDQVKGGGRGLFWTRQMTHNQIRRMFIECSYCDSMGMMACSCCTSHGCLVWGSSILTFIDIQLYIDLMIYTIVREGNKVPSLL